MALPTSGPLSLNQIHIEAGGTSGTTASINDADIRALIGKASGATMSFSEWYGASGSVTINLTIAANTNNYNIQSSRGGTYVAGVTTVNVTINSGVTVGSTSTGTYALETGSSWATGDVINIINNGTVKGRGANGGAGGDSFYNTINVAGNTSDPGAAGGVGGNAFRAQFATTFTNNGSVYGGGGGGGGGGGWTGLTGGKSVLATATGGGGGGGGAGVNAGSGGSGGVATSSSGGTLRNGTAGSTGSATAGGAGGASGNNEGAGGNGGAGGGLGSSGTAGSATADTGFTNAAGGSGGLAGFYQVGSSLINGGSGVGGTVGGRSS